MHYRDHEITGDTARQAQLHIEALEATVNDRILDILKNAPYDITVSGFRPVVGTDEQFLLLSDLSNTYDMNFSAIEFINTCFTFPNTDNYDLIKHIELRLNDGYMWTYAQTDTEGTLSYLSDTSDHIIGGINRHHVDTHGFVYSAAGLPYDLLCVKDASRFETLFDEFAKKCERLTARRDSSSVLDIASGIKITHEALYGKEDTGSEALVQELIIEMLHYRESGIELPHYDIPTTYPHFANHVVMRRDPEESRWVYGGSYDGPVEVGAILGEFHSRADILVPPSPALLSKIQAALAEKGV